MVIATPFEKKKHFYYNQKINLLKGRGLFSFGELRHQFKKRDTIGVLDWGRGVWTSGGILTGLDVARAIALGAVAGGGAYVVLHEAVESAEAVKGVLELMMEEFRTAMMLTGCSTVEELANADYVVLGETRQWVEE